MKESTKHLVEALYKAGYVNIDVIAKEGKVQAKDIIKQKTSKGGQKNAR